MPIAEASLYLFHADPEVHDDVIVPFESCGRWQSVSITLLGHVYHILTALLQIHKHIWREKRPSDPP